MNSPNGRPDAEQGVYRKYDVRRLNDKTGKHRDCHYYVLDLVHDRHSVPALLAYAGSCAAEFPTLAFDLRHQAAATSMRLGVTFEPKGWAIRHTDEKRWRTMDSIGCPDWTEDPTKALVCRLREHIERYADDDPEDIRIVEVDW